MDLTYLLSGTDIRAKEAALTPDVVKRIGAAFCEFIAERQNTGTDKITIAVGRDARRSGLAIEEAFIKGVTSKDSDVRLLGMCTTPAVHMAVTNLNCDGAAMITASNHPADRNGFKLVCKDGSLSAEDVLKILNRAQEIAIEERLVMPLDVMSEYKERLKSLVYGWMECSQQLPLLGLKVVVDACSSAGGFLKELFEELGCDTTGSLVGEIGMSPFDPTPISGAVVKNNADLGILIDADGDSVALIDPNGNTIGGNRLIALIAAIMLEDESGLTFVTDSVTSSGLTRFITEWGGHHYRFKRGYQNVINEAVRLNNEGINCPLAIETSGHVAFRDNDFIDDGVYLSMMIACEAMYRKRDGQSLFTLLDGLNEPKESYTVRLPIIQKNYKKAAGYVIAAVLSNTLVNKNWQLSQDNREGIRIMFNLKDGVQNGFFMLRLSVHDPVMPLNVESDVEGGVMTILNELYPILKNDNEELDLTPLEEYMKLQSEEL